MKSVIPIFTLLSFVAFTNLFGQSSNTLLGKFNVEKDILFGHFDCKTDVDDLHTIAAFATLLSKSEFSDVNFHAVAGAYGTQKGLYVPPNDLFQLAFGHKWSDAHENFDQALKEAKMKAETVLNDGGDLWIAEAGQSDFSAALVKGIKKDLPDLDSKTRIHIVQHSNWNEKVTSPDDLQYVNDHTDYHKIPDGNAVGNGTPGFKTETAVNWQELVKDNHKVEIWNLAIKLGNQYNGKDDRYLNTAIDAGGLDFSDLSETCWIFGLQDIKDAQAYFEYVAK